MLPLAPQSLNVVAGECARCGRRTDPADICAFCARKNEFGSRSRSSANCAVCRVALRVPSHYQAVLLCPPCQARHNADPDVVKPWEWLVPRANPYPVVTPFPRSTSASTIAYTYPDLPVPSPASSSLQNDVDLTLDVDARVTARDRLGDSAPPRVCVRSGCGVRLPAHVPGGMCAACVSSAGLVHRCSPPRGVVARECMPGHTFPRPRESPDLVRASLDQAVLGAMGQSDIEDVKSEPEVELVYPEDIPAMTQCAPTVPESRNHESKPAEDEELELELVYPEDAAETMLTPSPKPQAKPPTTLREFFTGGLQSIPALRDLAAPADQSPPRLCRMPGCNEVLPSQTRMERCVKCSISDWERRRMTHMNVSGPLLSPSANSPTANTSTEEEQMTTVDDEMSEVEDENEPPLPSSSPSKSIGNGLTDDHGIRLITGWDSDLTELSLSDIESENSSESDSDPDPGYSRSDRDATHLTIRVPLLVNRLPPDDLRRKCGNKRCNIALPRDHRWKTCDPCRRAHRIYQGVRLENIRRSIIGLEPLEPPEHLYRGWHSLRPEMSETDTILTPETSRPCSTKRCRRRIPLPEVYRWKTCVRCRAQGRRKARRKRDAGMEEQRALCQPEVVPRFPAYQNRVALLSSLDAQLRGFVEGQILYLRAKLHKGTTLDSDSRQPNCLPMIFVFVGEYSIVTGQREDDEDRGDAKPPDGATALDAMRTEVSSVVLDLERVLRTKFSAGEAFAIDEGGLIMQFTCSLELIAQLRPLTTRVGPGPGPRASTGGDDDNKNKDEPREGETPVVKPPPRPPAVPLVKMLSGELEAVVIPDESHRLFHGRRAVIRYYMFG